MISCKLQGGLGNQLFQIYATIAHADLTNSEFFFSNAYELNCSVTNRHTYWDTFLSNLQPFLLDPKLINQNNVIIIKEKGFTYSPLSMNEQSKLRILVGYFQSYKYFDNYFLTINRLLKIDEFKVRLTNKYLKLINEDKPISMHFRLGDYKKLPEHYQILNTNYYKTALKCLLETEQTNKKPDKTVLYFCEDQDLEDVESIIMELKAEFPGIIFMRPDPELEDWEQLILMSLCRHNIIANSTFSWWGAYLNTSREKTVVYPSMWFGPKIKHGLQDLFPENWIKICLDWIKIC
jgi:hypothetical protein